jgi:hypothetical protein
MWLQRETQSSMVVENLGSHFAFAGACTYHKSARQCSAMASISAKPVAA